MTNLGRHLGWKDYLNFFTVGLPRNMVWEGRLYFFKTPQQGAATTVAVASAPEVANGGYYRNCQLDDGAASESAKNDDDARALFDYCDEVTKSYQ
jgi:hypothetical protein